MAQLGGKLVALTMVAGMVPSIAAARPPRYQHASVKEHATADCAGCHGVKDQQLFTLWVPSSKPIHASCDGCHEKAYFQGLRKAGRGRPASVPFCATCHKGRGRKSLRFPPFRSRGASNFALARFDHGQHRRLKGATCEGCHETQGGAQSPTRAAHPQCAGCHREGASPLMTDCRGCHIASPGAEPSAFAEANPFRTWQAFDHIQHAAKLKRRGRCEDCHSQVAPGAGQVVPRPRKQDCEGCHDGNEAFSVLQSDCGRCHVEGKKR